MSESRGLAAEARASEAKRGLAVQLAASRMARRFRTGRMSTFFAASPVCAPRTSRETRSRLEERLADAGPRRPCRSSPGCSGSHLGEPRASRLSSPRLSAAAPRIVYEWLGALSSTTPVVLALEDLHWADPSSLELTAELQRFTADRPARSSSSPADPRRDQIEELGRRSSNTSTRLGPLEGEALGHSSPDCSRRTGTGGARRHCSTRPAGTRSSSRSSYARCTSGRPRRVTTAWADRPGWDEAAVPTTRGRARSADRSAATRRRGTAPNGCGGRTTRSACRCSSRSCPAPASSRIDELVHSGFLERCRRSDVATARVPPCPRPGCGVLAAAPPATARAPPSCRRGRRGPLRRGRRRHRPAGAPPLPRRGGGEGRGLSRPCRRARERLFANEEAIVHFGRAAEWRRSCPSSSERRTEILLELADLHDLVGDYDEAFRLYTEVARALARRSCLAGDGRGPPEAGGVTNEALAVVEEAFTDPALAGSDLTPLWLEQGWSLSVMGRFDQAIEVLEAALLNAGGANTDRRRPAAAAARAGRDASRDASSLRCSGASSRRRSSTSSTTLGAWQRLIESSATSTAPRHARRGGGLAARGLEVAERIGSVEEIGGCLVNLALVAQRPR